jgi:hypothetical protein
MTIAEIIGIGGFPANAASHLCTFDFGVPGVVADRFATRRMSPMARAFKLQCRQRSNSRRQQEFRVYYARGR